MKVPIKHSDITFLATVPDNASVNDLIISTFLSLPMAEPPVANLLINSPNDINLWYGGRKMDHNLPLSHYGISPSSLNNENFTIHLTSINNINSNIPISSSSSTTTTTTSSTSTTVVIPTNKSKSTKSTKSKSKSKSKSKKCFFDHCTSNQLRMVGDCQFCQGKFCSKHRLLENHNCSGLKICKDKSYERNALKLQSEQVVTSKV